MPSHSTSVNDESRILILVVEDNSINARLICEVLHAGGYRTRVAVDGREGLQAAHDWRPTLIVTDLQMPGLDGVAMTKLLKAAPETASIPVIAVSAHAMADHITVAKEAGCITFITKPIRFQSFLAEVAHVLKGA